MPEGVYWSPVFGAYVCAHGSPVKIECMELNLRLDTFTRCQETTDVYVSLVEELIESLTYAKNLVESSSEVAIIENLLRKANKTRSAKK